jgi:hypothetical protein
MESVVSYQEDTIDWRAIVYVNNWLDEKVSHIYLDQPLAQDWARISKISEELGEAIQAFIGYTAENPRKGKTHELDDVLDELADAALTAILAIQHFTNSSNKTRQILQSKIGAIYARIPK